MIPLNHVAAERARDAVITQRTPTPALVIDPEKLLLNLFDVRSKCPHVEIRYSPSWNSSRAIIRLLAGEDVDFDASSIGEVVVLIRNGVSPSAIAFMAAVKSHKDIAAARALDVRTFAVASLAELEKVIAHGSDVEVVVALTSEIPISHEELLVVLDAAERSRVVSIGLAVGPDDSFLDDLFAVPGLLGPGSVPIRSLRISGGVSSLEALAARMQDGVTSGPHIAGKVSINCSSELLKGAACLISEVIGSSRHGDRSFVHLDLPPIGDFGPGPVQFASFDRELVVEDEAVVCIADPESERVNTLRAELPVDLAVGELVGLTSTHRVIGPVSQIVLDARYHGKERPYRTIVVGDPDFEEACELEFRCFEEAGILSADGSFQGRRVDDISRLLIVPPEGPIAGILRTVDASEFGFETFHYAVLDEFGMSVMRDTDLSTAVEVISSAPINRDPIVALELYRAIMLDCVVRGKTTIFAIMGDSVWRGINKHLGVDGYGPFVPLGPIDHRLNERPVMLDIRRCERDLDLIEALRARSERYRRAQERRKPRAEII